MHDAPTITHDARTINNLLNFHDPRTIMIKHTNERFLPLKKSSVNLWKMISERNKKSIASSIYYETLKSNQYHKYNNVISKRKKTSKNIIFYDEKKNVRVVLNFSHLV